MGESKDGCEVDPRKASVWKAPPPSELWSSSNGPLFSVLWDSCLDPHVLEFRTKQAAEQPAPAWQPVFHQFMFSVSIIGKILYEHKYEPVRIFFQDPSGENGIIIDVMKVLVCPSNIPHHSTADGRDSPLILVRYHQLNKSSLNAEKLHELMHAGDLCKDILTSTPENAVETPTGKSTNQKHKKKNKVKEVMTLPKIPVPASSKSEVTFAAHFLKKQQALLSPEYVSYFNTLSPAHTGSGDVFQPSFLVLPPGEKTITPEKFLARCAFCATTPNTKAVCAKCKKATYCSRDCQVADWPVHKLTCGKATLSPEQQRQALQGGAGGADVNK
mmetsp:Transcript_22347/g.44333  ORF Transcript_22347/g.44333 Transcript_22347/m.44333 type:complete len:329 (+) Transcript_22347:38-1024(+)